MANRPPNIAVFGAEGDNLPIVSLLVAMRNEERYIGECLASVLAQDYPAERLEVVVLDGNSSDRSREIVRDLIAGRPNARLVQNPRVTQAAAWNLGVSTSHGDVIGIMSGHVTLARDYVIAGVEALRRTGATMVGGPVRAISDGVVGQAIALATSTPYGVGGARFRYTDRDEQVDTVFMGIGRRSVFERFPFDEEMVRNQDDELSYRILDAGGVIFCSPSIKSAYRNRGSFRALFRQYFDYGYWKVRVMQKHPRQIRPRQLIPPAFVIAGITSAALVLVSSAGGGLLKLLLLSYGIMSAVAAGWVGRREPRLIPLLPVAFGVLHVSYGLGVLAGIGNAIGRHLAGRRKISTASDPPGEAVGPRGKPHRKVESGSAEARAHLDEVDQRADP